MDLKDIATSNLDVQGHLDVAKLTEPSYCAKIVMDADIPNPSFESETHFEIRYGCGDEEKHGDKYRLRKESLIHILLTMATTKMDDDPPLFPHLAETDDRQHLFVFSIPTNSNIIGGAATNEYGFLCISFAYWIELLVLILFTLAIAAIVGFF